MGQAYGFAFLLFRRVLLLYVVSSLWLILVTTSAMNGHTRSTNFFNSAGVRRAEYHVWSIRSAAWPGGKTAATSSIMTFRATIKGSLSIDNTSAITVVLFGKNADRIDDIP